MERRLRTFVLFLLACAAVVGARAETPSWDDDFRGAFASLAEERGRDLSPLALDLAVSLGPQRLSSLDAVAAASLALELASGIDADLRSGISIQESRARASQLAGFLARDSVVGKGDQSRSLLRMRVQGDLAARMHGGSATSTGRDTRGADSKHGRKGPAN